MIPVRPSQQVACAHCKGKLHSKDRASHTGSFNSFAGFIKYHGGYLKGLATFRSQSLQRVAHIKTVFQTNQRSLTGLGL